MRLKEYLKWKGLKYREFAKDLGMSTATLGLYVWGKRIPRLDKACLIQEYTLGHVTATMIDWPLIDAKKKKAISSKTSKAKTKKTKT